MTKCPGSLSETFSVERGVPACDMCGMLFARGVMVIPPHYLEPAAPAAAARPHLPTG